MPVHARMKKVLARKALIIAALAALVFQAARGQSDNPKPGATAKTTLVTAGGQPVAVLTPILSRMADMGMVFRLYRMPVREKIGPRNTRLRQATSPRGTAISKPTPTAMTVSSMCCTSAAVMTSTCPDTQDHRIHGSTTAPTTPVASIRRC